MTELYHLLQLHFCRFTEKRVSAVAVSCDGLYVTFADKFGLVWLVSLGEDVEGHALVDNKPVPILGHYCSIITSMVRISSIILCLLFFSILLYFYSSALILCRVIAIERSLKTKSLILN